MELPCFFKDFLTRNSLSYDLYSIDTLSKIPRSFVVNYGFNSCSKAEILEEFPNATQLQLADDYSWYEMDCSINMGSSKLFKQGKILSMDFSSIFSIFSLNLKPSDHLLDMCCSPGLKLALAATIIGPSGTGSVTGVDISSIRLKNSVSIIKKFKISKCRLFKADSISFSVGVTLPENHISTLDNLTREKRCQSTNIFYSTSQYRKRICYHQIVPLYDKIVLDSQCTHDGSIKHIIKSLCIKNTSNGKKELLLNNSIRIPLVS